VPVPGVVAADLVVVQAGLVLAGLEAFLDGLITSGKFCCARRLRLSLTWWHRPLRLRRSALQADFPPVGEPDEPDVDRQPPAHSASHPRPAPRSSSRSCVPTVTAAPADTPAPASASRPARTSPRPARIRHRTPLATPQGLTWAARPPPDLRDRSHLAELRGGRIYVTPPRRTRSRAAAVVLEERSLAIKERQE